MYMYVAIASAFGISCKFLFYLDFFNAEIIDGIFFGGFTLKNNSHTNFCIRFSIFMLIEVTNNL